MGLMAVPRVAPRAGASPAPTIYGWASHSCMVGATLAVALQAGRGYHIRLGVPFVYGRGDPCGRPAGGALDAYGGLACLPPPWLFQ